MDQFQSLESQQISFRLKVIVTVRNVTPVCEQS